MKDRQKNRQDDLLSMFLDAEVESEHLTTEEILGICFLFILAGLDTVTDSLECFVARLAQHPDERTQIVDDPSIIPSAVEELLRWETPVTTVARVATRDIDLGGCPIRAGENIGVVIGAANTDEESLPGSDQVDLNRNPNRHLAFGGGVHRCLGFPSGPPRAAHRPARMASPHPRVRHRARYRAELPDGSSSHRAAATHLRRRAVTAVSRSRRGCHASGPGVD